MAISLGRTRAGMCALQSRYSKGFVDKGREMAISLAAQSPDVLLWTLACAQVAELVDALASGASGRKVVEVRVFSWAPFWASDTAPVAKPVHLFHRRGRL